MTSTETTNEPIDVVKQRLNDPATAAALVTLLDNAELLSTLVLGLSGLIGRGETIMDSVAEGVQDFRASGASIRPEGAPTLEEMGALAAQLAAAGPILEAGLNSSIARPETIAVLSMLSEAATDGAAVAARHDHPKLGVIGITRALRDDDVQRGVNWFIEIARSLGRHLDTNSGNPR